MVQGGFGAQSPPRAQGRVVRAIRAAIRTRIGTPRAGLAGPVRPLVVLSIALSIACALVAAGAHAASAATLTVSAASSLTDVLRDVKAAWIKAHPETSIALNLAGSGTLKIQIEGGAPVDVFAPAGLDPMRALVREGRVDSTEVRIFARNRLVLIVPDSADTTRAIRFLLDLKRPSVRRIALGDEAYVPAGLYAAQTLRHYGLYEPLRGRLVPAETVRQVLEYVASGAADAGFVYTTDIDPGSKVRVAWIVPDTAHDPILYPIAPVAGGDHEEAARRFVAFMTQPEVRAILASHGFLAPPRAAEPPPEPGSR